MPDIDLPRFARRATRGRTRVQPAKTASPAPDSVGSSVPENSSLNASVYEGLAAFRLAMRRFLAFSEAAAGAAGITTQQYQAMLVIKVHAAEAIMMRDLAEEMLLLPNGAVQLVDRLASTGLVERRQSLTDGRSVLVVLTPAGRALLEVLAADHFREMIKHEPLLADSLRRLRKMGAAR